MGLGEGGGGVNGKEMAGGGSDRSQQQGKLQPTAAAGMARSKGEISLRKIGGRIQCGEEAACLPRGEEGVPCRPLLSPPLALNLTLLGFA